MKNLKSVAIILMVFGLMPMMALSKTWVDPCTGIAWPAEDWIDPCTGIAWTYVVRDGAVEICEIPSSTTGVLTIPSMLGGYPVTSVGNYAFFDCSGLTAVTIPSSVTNIGTSAFYGCRGLTSIRILEGVTNIGKSAFGECSGLMSMTIPSTVMSIGEMAFTFCGTLKSFSVAEDNQKFKSINELLCSKDGTKLLEGVNGDVVIPSGVTSIRQYAFAGRGGLTSVAISSTVKEIERGAFASCNSLTSLTIPSSVISIWQEAFAFCGALKSFLVDEDNQKFKSINELLCSKDGTQLFEGVNGDIVIPSGVTSIEPWAFEGRTGLKSVMIPSSVVSIRTGAFAQCKGLISVIIQEGVVDFESDIFLGCSGLTSVTIPSSVTSIGGSAFLACSEVEEMEFCGTVPIGFENASIDNSVFIWYNARYASEWQKVLADNGYNNSAPCKPCSCSKCKEGCSASVVSTTVNVISSNVVVNYVLTSVKPEFAIPASLDVGFVNIITEVKGGCVAVPATWMVNYPNFVSKYGSDFTKALTMKTGKKDGTGNEMLVWQDYVAGTDPTDENDVFRASITIVDGKVTISYTPELDDTRKAMRKYTTWGKSSLLDADWTEVPKGDESKFNFFKVSVEMR